jgi:hypothetical protein
MRPSALGISILTTRPRKSYQLKREEGPELGRQGFQKSHRDLASLPIRSNPVPVTLLTRL